jgi:hypothetical protein
MNPTAFGSGAVKAWELDMETPRTDEDAKYCAMNRRGLSLTAIRRRRPRAV